jgi:hypothetical protein
MNRCKFCGNDGSDESGLLPIRGYDWDSADDTALSVSRVVGYVCADRGACSRRIVEQGTSIEGLKEIVLVDRQELPADLVNQAIALLHEWNGLYAMTARGADAAAREDGWGVMTGGRA